MKRCKKPPSKILDSPLDARFGAENLVLSSTDENRFKVKSMGTALPPPPHIQANKKYIGHVVTKPPSPHLWWSTCRQLLEINFRKILNSNFHAAQTRQNTKENNNINSQAKVTTNFRPTYRLLVIISTGRSYPCDTRDKVIAVLMSRWHCISRAGSTDLRPFLNTQL